MKLGSLSAVQQICAVFETVYANMLIWRRTVDQIYILLHNTLNMTPYNFCKIGHFIKGGIGFM